jgi:hypothetical protein
MERYQPKVSPGRYVGSTGVVYVLATAKKTASISVIKSLMNTKKRGEVVENKNIDIGQSITAMGNQIPLQIASSESHLDILLSGL